jgi:predicted Zn-dependent protease with MMP-like domain
MRQRAAVYRELKRRQFERMVERAVASLGDDLRAKLENVEIVVEPESRTEAGRADGEALFGYYEGVPLTERTTGYGMTLPDKITIYQGPLERAFPDPADLFEQVRITVLHEIAHHFGIDEDRLAELGYE